MVNGERIPRSRESRHVSWRTAWPIFRAAGIYRVGPGPPPTPGGRPGPLKIFYYHLTADGQAAWVVQPPADLAAAPTQALGRGYWFATAERNLYVCWHD